MNLDCISGKPSPILVVPLLTSNAAPITDWWWVLEDTISWVVYRSIHSQTTMHCVGTERKLPFRCFRNCGA